MDVIFIILFIFLLNSFFIRSLAADTRIHSTGYLWLLFSVHLLLTIAYVLYTVDNRSDSVSYFTSANNTSDWFSFFETGTKFVGFIAWPFINVLGLSYYAVMLLFSYIGFVAIVLFYLVAVENIRLDPVFNGLTPIELLFLLPNLHFWTSSLGKGSAILFGLGLFSYGLSRFNRRITPIVLGGFMMYMLRPHILLAYVVALIIALFTSNIGLKPVYKWMILAVAFIAFFYLSGSVLQFTDTDSLDITQSETLMHRTSELSHATSGVDLQNYNIVFKLFTFWFRPIFFDQLGLMGFIVSFENAIYLFLFFLVIRMLIKNWDAYNGYFRVSLFMFLIASIILAQVSGNLGIALRQKTQIMPFLFILYCKSLTLRPVVSRR
jgi:hypothetical protein